MLKDQLRRPPKGKIKIFYLSILKSDVSYGWNQICEKHYAPELRRKEDDVSPLGREWMMLMREEEARQRREQEKLRKQAILEEHATRAKKGPAAPGGIGGGMNRTEGEREGRTRADS